MTKSPRLKVHGRVTSAAKARRTVLLFHIDGTLVLSGGAGARAMARAFENLFGIDHAFHRIPMPGRTDTWILIDACAAHAVSTDHDTFTRFRSLYVTLLTQELQNPGPRKGVMPGVRQLLEELSDRDDVYLALLTGNFEPAARAKLEYFDLWQYFGCGAFGDGEPDRNVLLPRALRRIVECGGPRVAAGDTVVIGDTPLDVGCAKAGGARSIAVATGDYDVNALRAAGADVVFKDLSDTDAVIDAMGIGG